MAKQSVSKLVNSSANGAKKIVSKVARGTSNVVSGVAKGTSSVVSNVAKSGSKVVSSTARTGSNIVTGTAGVATKTVTAPVKTVKSLTGTTTKGFSKLESFCNSENIIPCLTALTLIAYIVIVNPATVLDLFSTKLGKALSMLIVLIALLFDLKLGVMLGLAVILSISLSSVNKDLYESFGMSGSYTPHHYPFANANMDASNNVVESFKGGLEDILLDEDVEMPEKPEMPADKDLLEEEEDDIELEDMLKENSPEPKPSKHQLSQGGAVTVTCGEGFTNPSSDNYEIEGMDSAVCKFASFAPVEPS